MNKVALHRALMHSPVSQIRAFTSIGSTNDEALQWIDEDAPDFALVIADQQTKGRGRLNRAWITQPEASLAFSVIFRPTRSELAAPSALYAPLCGLAVCQTLRESLELNPKIKWPNDILLEQQKCCGILVEASWTGVQLNGIVMGIGINITAQAIPPDAILRFPATWVEKYTRQPVERFNLLAQITSAMQFWRSHMDSREFIETWQKQLAFRGETVRIVQNEKTSIIGIEEGIDGLGNLVLREVSGKITTVEVGDVSLRLED